MEKKMRMRKDAKAQGDKTPRPNLGDTSRYGSTPTFSLLSLIHFTYSFPQSPAFHTRWRHELNTIHTSIHTHLSDLVHPSLGLPDCAWTYGMNSRIQISISLSCDTNITLTVLVHQCIFLHARIDEFTDD